MSRMPSPGLPKPFALLEASSPGQSPLTLDQDDVRELYQRSGAVLLRGFALDTGIFRQFAEVFCSTAVHNDAGGREIVDAANNIQSVNLGPDSFPLHPELSLVPWKPDVCFFACLKAPGQGGETTICDGTQIVAAMPAQLRQSLQDRGLVYAKAIAPEQCRYWLGTDEPDDRLLAHPPGHCPFSFVRRGRHIIRINTAPVLHTPMFCDQPAFGNFLLFARLHLGLMDFPTFEDGERIPQDVVDQVDEISRAFTVKIAWQQGDILMLDNTRFMHGRRSVPDTAQRRIVSYFGYLKFAVPGANGPADAIWRQPGFRGFYR